MSAAPWLLITPLTIVTMLMLYSSPALHCVPLPRSVWYVYWTVLLYALLHLKTNTPAHRPICSSSAPQIWIYQMRELPCITSWWTNTRKVARMCAERPVNIWVQNRGKNCNNADYKDERPAPRFNLSDGRNWCDRRPGRCNTRDRGCRE